jgi:hypothetical protein
LDEGPRDERLYRFMAPGKDSVGNDEVKEGGEGKKSNDEEVREMRVSFNRHAVEFLLIYEVD